MINSNSQHPRQIPDTLNVNLKAKYFMRQEPKRTITFQMDLCLLTNWLVNYANIFRFLCLFIFLSVDNAIELNVMRLKSKETKDFYKPLFYRKPDYTIFVYLQTFYFCSKFLASPKTGSFN